MLEVIFILQIDIFQVIKTYYTFVNEEFLIGKMLKMLLLEVWALSFSQMLS